PRGRNGERRIEMLGDAVRELEPYQSRGCKNGGVILALIELAQTRLDIAAQRYDVEIGTRVSELRLAARARRSNSRPPGQLCERRVTIRDKCIARVGPRQHCSERHPRGQLAGHVRHRMDSDVRMPIEDRALELFDEKSLAADFRQRTVDDSLTLSCHRHEHDLELREARAQACSHVLGLPERETTLSSRNAQRVGRTCHDSLDLHSGVGIVERAASARRRSSMKRINAMMSASTTGPKNKPIAPKAEMPPSTPMNTVSVLTEARPETSMGRTTLSTRPTSSVPQSSMKIAAPQRP